MWTSGIDVVFWWVVLVCLPHVNYGQEQRRQSGDLIDGDYNDIIDKLNNLSSRLSTVESKIPTSAVAFKAHLRHSSMPSANELIVFDDIQFNLGTAYHRGIFVAPYTGLYLFSVSVCSNNGHFIDVELKRNGDIIGQVLAGDSVYNDCSSETTITELNQGDSVTVQHHGTIGDYLQGTVHALNSFTGVLLSLQ